jgi:hypothetical protein
VIDIDGVIEGDIDDVGVNETVIVGVGVGEGSHVIDIPGPEDG